MKSFLYIVRRGAHRFTKLFYHKETEKAIPFFTFLLRILYFLTPRRHTHFELARFIWLKVTKKFGKVHKKAAFGLTFNAPWGYNGTNKIL